MYIFITQMETVQDQDFIIINKFNPGETPNAITFTGKFHTTPFIFRGMSGFKLVNFTGSAVVITFQSPDVIYNTKFKIFFFFDYPSGIMYFVMYS